MEMLHSKASDTELMQRFIAGDEAAFTALVRRYESLLFATARRMLIDEYLAQEASQHTWLQLFRTKPFPSGDASLKPWLLTVFSHRCISEIRKKKKMSLLLSHFSHIERENGGEDSLLDMLIDPAPGPEDIVESQEVYQRFKEAINRLPEKFRAVILLRLTDELTFIEIAHRLSCREGTVRVHARRARILLHRALNR